jgi:hypothetical protein
MSSVAALIKLIDYRIPNVRLTNLIRYVGESGINLEMVTHVYVSKVKPYENITW